MRLELGLKPSGAELLSASQGTAESRKTWHTVQLSWQVLQLAWRSPVRVFAKEASFAFECLPRLCVSVERRQVVIQSVVVCFAEASKTFHWLVGLHDHIVRFQSVSRRLVKTQFSHNCNESYQL